MTTDIEASNTDTLDIILADIRRRLEACWDADTSAGGYTAERPSTGQCAVSALIVQDLLGGKLIRVVNAGDSHYFNEIAAGREVDLTRDQFPIWAPEPERAERERSYVLSHPATAARYELLAARFASLPS